MNMVINGRNYELSFAEIGAFACREHSSDAQIAASANPTDANIDAANYARGFRAFATLVPTAEPWAKYRIGLRADGVWDAGAWTRSVGDGWALQRALWLAYDPAAYDEVRVRCAYVARMYRAIELCRRSGQRVENREVELAAFVDAA